MPLPGVGTAAIVLAETGVPVLPGFIRGTETAMPRGARLPRPSKVRVVLGAPITATTLEARGDGKDSYTRITDALQKETARIAAQAQRLSGKATDRTP